MRREAKGSCGRCWLFGLSVIALASLGANDPGDAAAVQSIEMMPDPNWVPRPGDRVETNDTAAGLPDYLEYLDYEKHAAANDQTEVQKMLDAKQVIRIPKGVKLLIIKSYRPEKPAVVYRSGLSTDGARRAMQARILNSSSDEASVYALEVRVLDGEFKGQVKVIPDASAAKMVPAPPAKGFALRLPGESSFGFKDFRRPFLQAERKPRGKRADPATRAANLLRAGQKADKSGDIIGAVSAYWFVYKDFPGTESARKARDRLNAWGFKREPTGRGYRLDLGKAKRR